MSKFDITAAFQQAARPQGAAERTIEAVTTELLDAKRRGGEAILTIGRCLMEAKEMLPHGEWLPWLNERVELSERTAQKFMKLAREWSNPNTLADLGASKALMLLALPPEEREAFAEDHNVIDMSARQLEQAIRERDEARRAAEAARAEASAAEQTRAKMEADMAVANAALASAREEKKMADHEVERLAKKVLELKARPVEVAVETVVDQEAVEQARAEAEARLQAKLDKAQKAKDQAEARQKEADEALEALRAQMAAQARAEKKDALGADKDLAQFEVLFDQVQEIVNKMSGILLKVRGRDQDAAGRLARAMQALAEAVRRCGA